VFLYLEDPRLIAAVIVLLALCFMAGIVGGLLFMFRERPAVRGVDRITTPTVTAPPVNSDVQELRRLANTIKRVSHA